MKLNCKSNLFLIMVLFLPGHLAGQEMIMPPGGDPGRASLHKEVLKSTQADTLEIPFADEFSYGPGFPDPSLWADDYAYVNHSYAVGAPTIGVATLDALDWDGVVYPFSTISPETFDADFLTSWPIDLALEASDSVYLSFFYQPMGNGLEPSRYDSLCLDFYDIQDSSWINVWQVAGDTLRDFRQVMIPITEERFLTKGFRFSFRNKASLPKNADYRDKRGNVDHWNIDYVRLDKNRTAADTVIRDVAFSEPLSSMLKGYQSIPWDHFKAANTSTYLTYFRINYFNNDTAVRNITRRLQVYDEVWDELYQPNNASAQDIFPDNEISYQITSIYPFNFDRGDTASFLVKSWLRTDDFDYKQNDTITRRQVFNDYFAYDDGTAERAYGLRGQGTSNGLVAVKFNSFIPDELGGVDAYFTQLYDSLNLSYYFKFMVWNDDNGQPGEVIYESEADYTVAYSDRINKFMRFEFDRTVPVNGTFYVGLMQYNQYMLNIGLDVNTNKNQNLLFNIGGGWQNSAAPGNIMLRPYVKRAFSSIGPEPSPHHSIRLWPNPSSDIIYIESAGEEPQAIQRIEIYNLNGQVVLSEEVNTGSLHVDQLPEGVYFLKAYREFQPSAITKFIINR